MPHPSLIQRTCKSLARGRTESFNNKFFLAWLLLISTGNSALHPSACMGSLNRVPVLIGWCKGWWQVGLYKYCVIHMACELPQRRGMLRTGLLTIYNFRFTSAFSHGRPSQSCFPDSELRPMTFNLDLYRSWRTKYLGLKSFNSK